MLYFKNNIVLPRHKINNLKGWKELEYNIPEFNDETHRISHYTFKELTKKVIAHANIIEIEDDELEDEE